MANRTILMISYWYPPTPGAGAQRAAGFARHLAEYGWKPIVLAAGDAESGIESSQEGPVTVHRVRDFRTPRSALVDYVGPPEPTLLKRVLRSFRLTNRFLYWSTRSAPVAGRIARDNSVDLVWATFPPDVVPWLANEAAIVLAVPYVLDLRDPWLGPGGYEAYSRWQARQYAKTEKKSLLAAGLIVVISDAMRDDLVNRAGVPADRITVIPNGFDADRCKKLETIESAGTSTLTHVGSVIQRNRPDLFFKALGSNKARLAGTKVRFVGNLASSHVAALGLSDVVSTTGLVSAPDAWRETCAADALLLLVGDYVGRWGHNAKMFEYIRSGRPILCLEETPGSNDRRLLEQLAPERTVFASLTQPDDIIAGIGRVVELAKSIPFGQLDDSPGLMRYDRRRLAGELADVLNRLLADATRPSSP